MGVPCGSLAHCSGRKYGLTVFRERNMRRPCLSTDGIVVSVIPDAKEFTYPRTFLVQARYCKQLWLVYSDDV